MGKGRPKIFIVYIAYYHALILYPVIIIDLSLLNLVIKIKMGISQQFQALIISRNSLVYASYSYEILQQGSSSRLTKAK